MIHTTMKLAFGICAAGFAISQLCGPANAGSVNYKVCLGEREEHCQAHDRYQYCYTYPALAAWATAICGVAPVIQQYNSYGGDKCGYAMYMVICDSPKGSAVPAQKPLEEQ
jgi:hypothetical protein